MKVKDYAAVADPQQQIMIFMLNDTGTPYYGGSVQELKEDIKVDKPLGNSIVCLITRGDSPSCLTPSVMPSITVIYATCDVDSRL